MYWDDHNKPHFHAWYSGDKAKFDIKAGKFVRGKLPPIAEKLVKKWAKGHKEELLAEWDLAEDQRPLFPIEPLE